MLDNFPHVKAYWIMLGQKMAQVALAFGADDLDGTVTEERITRAIEVYFSFVLTVDSPWTPRASASRYLCD